MSEWVKIIQGGVRGKRFSKELIKTDKYCQERNEEGNIEEVKLLEVFVDSDNCGM